VNPSAKAVPAQKPAVAEAVANAPAESTGPPPVINVPEKIEQHIRESPNADAQQDVWTLMVPWVLEELLKRTHAGAFEAVLPGANMAGTSINVSNPATGHINGFRQEAQI